MTRTALRYALFQLPGLALAAAGLRLAVAQEWISTGVGFGGFAFWLAKDIALYPFLREAYRPDPKGPGEALAGRVVVAQDELDPEGRVSLGGESWRARKSAASGTLAAGGRARVVELDGLCLVVEAIPDPPRGGEGGNTGSSPGGVA